MDKPAQSFRPSAGLLLAGAVAVGLLLRCIHYFARASFWGDEGFLLLNLRTYSLGRLLTGRLDAVQTVLDDANATQAGPLGFIAVLKLLMPAAGPASELAMRAMPFAFSCAALVVFACLARRVVPQWAWAATLAFACHEELLHQTANTKHYAIDVFATLLLAWLALGRSARSAAIRTRPWALLLLTLVLLALCYAPVIVAPVALVAAWVHDRQSAHRSTISYVACFLAFAAAALAIKHYNVDVQQDAYLARYWSEAFPSWRRPATVPGWLFNNTVELWNYAAPGLIVGFGLVVAQLALVPARRTDAATLVLVGTGLATLAAAMAGLFPYQGRRVDLFLVPLLLLATLRAAIDLATLARERLPERPLHLLPAGLAAVPLILAMAVGIRQTATDIHANGRFRQVTTELLATRTPEQQLLFLGPAPSSLAIAYGFDAEPDTFTTPMLPLLDPSRPVIVTLGPRIDASERATLLAETPELTPRRIERTTPPKAGNLVYLAPVPPLPAP